MGTFKAYGGLRALNYFRFASGNLERNCPPYYVMNSSTPIIGIMGRETASSNNNAAVNGMYSIVAYATADELEDYSIDDYTVTALGTTTCTLSMNSVSGSVTATVSMAANSDTTIKCIKFVSTKGWFGERQD